MKKQVQCRGKDIQFRGGDQEALPSVSTAPKAKQQSGLASTPHLKHHIPALPPWAQYPFSTVM